MSVLLDAERRLIDLLQHPLEAGDDSARHTEQLARWQADLLAAMEAHAAADEDLHAGQPLADAFAQIGDWMRRAPADWREHWASLQPALALAAQFPDACILLVFGKFNAGKSSLCNFLAQRLSPRTMTGMRGFQLHDGQIVASDAPLTEGAMETTVALQGVVLADGLVLIDTPGLHSSTVENAALTLRFTDCADGMLWLTSSTAPGQVQELDELASELRRGKPLQPILTRSDVFEEDEHDGELVRLLRNKSADNRQLQEADVAARARERLRTLAVDEQLLRAPVSVSIHAARTLGDAPAALVDAGIERLYDALSAMVAPALAYRSRKPAAVLLHHCEERIQASLDGGLLPLVDALAGQLARARAALDGDADLACSRARRALLLQIGAIVDQAVSSGDIDAATARASQVLAEAFGLHRSPMLGELVPVPAALHGALLLPADSLHEAAAADSIGTDSHAPAPPSHERLHRAIEDAVQTRLDRLRAELVQQAGLALDGLEARVQAIKSVVEHAGTSLQRIRSALPPATQHGAAS